VPEASVRPTDLIKARRTAEAAVADMADGPLKVAAFETILSRLLDRQLGVTPEALVPTPARTGGKRSVTTGRILSLRDDGFFSQPRSLGEVKAALAERGWHYPQENLGTPLTRLVQKKFLRRAQVANGGKKLWKYSLY